MLTLGVSIFVFLAGTAPRAGPAARLHFYRDVFPILQTHCQECHRPGEVAPMPF